MKKEELAYSIGYRINKLGEVISPRGLKLKFDISNGYFRFGIKINGKTIKIKVHRFQAYIKFRSLLYNDGIVVRHLNGIRSDNTWDNIEIGTSSDNMMDIPKDVRLNKASKASRKYDHISILRDHKNGYSYKDLMLKYNISSKGTISFIIRNSLAH